MHIKMYLGDDPIVSVELSYMAVINGERIAPCAVTEETERYWASHHGFATLLRWMQHNGMADKIDAWSLSLRQAEGCGLDLGKCELLWEGLV